MTLRLSQCERHRKRYRTSGLVHSGGPPEPRADADAIHANEKLIRDARLRGRVMPLTGDRSEGDAEGGRLHRATVTGRDSIRGSRTLQFVIFIFAAVLLVVAATFYVASLVPPRPSPTDRFVFSDVALADGNASFVVQSESGGPYPYSGFRATLVVNDFASPSVALGARQSIVRVSIGPNSYRIMWRDADGDGAPSVGDSFLVSGDATPLPSISAYEFDLQWQGGWIAKAFWTTG